MCTTCLLLIAFVAGGTGCDASQREPTPADETGIGPPPAPVIPSGPIPMAPPRLWLFDSETDTAEPAEFTGYGGKWSIDSRNPSPRYYQSLCHEPSDSSVSAPHAFEKRRQREGDMAIADDAYFSNVDFSAYIKAATETPGASAGLAFGITAGDDFYLASISPADERAELLRIRPRGGEVIATGGFNADASEAGTSQWHLVRVRAFGTGIEMFIDDVSAARGTVDGISPGMIGLWTNGTTTACFDEIAAAPR